MKIFGESPEGKAIMQGIYWVAMFICALLAIFFYLMDRTYKGVFDALFYILAYFIGLNVSVGFLGVFTPVVIQSFVAIITFMICKLSGLTTATSIITSEIVFIIITLLTFRLTYRQGIREKNIK